MSTLELHGVAKSYKGRLLFRNVDLSLQPGRICGIEGPNGAGKSVLFKIMCRFVRPDEGTVTIAPQYCRPGSTFPADFGVIIDRPGYIAGRTGLDNLKALAAIRGKITEGDVRAAMCRVGLDPETKQKVRNYSLGMKQKLALAQAIMEDQQVLILDEPFNGLDSASIDATRALLHQLREDGRTIAFTSHNHEDMTLLCDQRYRLNAETLEPLPF